MDASPAKQLRRAAGDTRVMTASNLFPTLVARQQLHFRRLAFYGFSIAGLLLAVTMMDTPRSWRGIAAALIIPAIAAAIWFIRDSRRLLRIPAIVELLDNTARIDAVHLDGAVAHLYLRSDNRVDFLLRSSERDQVIQALRTHSPDARFVEGTTLPTAILRR
jgi:hypothetical protein